MKYLAYFSAVAAILSCSTVYAQGIDRFTPNAIIGDGKDNNSYARWTQQIKDAPLQSVTARVKRLKGSNSTYVNARFHNGLTFENGKRVYLTDANSQVVTWNAVGQRSNGEPLIIMCYAGEAVVELVEVRYASSPGGIGLGGAIDPPHGNHDGGIGNGDPRPNDPQAEARCRNIRTRSPRIEIARVKPVGGLFSGKYRVEGSIYGQCIEEVGYFERGRIRSKIEYPLDDRFQRREFDVKVQSGQRGELRAYTTDGREEFIDIDDEISQQGYSR